MIRHIVMWNLHKNARGLTRADNARYLKQRLESLPASIPEIVDLEVGLNFNTSDAAADVVLHTTFHSVADLQKYQQHPDHQEVAQLLREIAGNRRVVDYEI